MPKTKNQTTIIPHTSKPRTIDELREQLCDAFQLAKRDKKHTAQVEVMTNAAGKIISTVKTQLEYAVIRNEEPDIPFMGKTSHRPIRGRRMLPAGSN